MISGQAAWPSCSARGRSVVKPRNDSFFIGDQLVWRQNEDKFRMHRSRDGLMAAVSDGAGGTGLFCGAWAETLVNRLPRRPIVGIGELNRWLDGFCLSFRSDYAQKAKSQPVKHTKFVREGSCAALAVCWLTFLRSRTVMRWLGYGDSQIMVFDRTGPRPVLATSYPPNLSDLDRTPALLNWKDLPNKDRLSTGAVTLPACATIVVASDGIGQYIMLRYLALHVPGTSNSKMAEEFSRLAGGDSKFGDAIRAHRKQAQEPFSRLLESLRQALKSDRAFLAYVRARHKEGLLANDDATLLLIDIDTTEHPQTASLGSTG
ncbi:Putative serine/threonine phosphatase 2C [Rhodospirillaceae bacterium LM-1]|nr:Putative serine/threonine phosphatase 2C [Rhodospirillaceae bacterium LM-1]